MTPDERLKREQGEKLAAQVRSNQAQHAADAQRKALNARNNVASYTADMGLPPGIYAQMREKAKALIKSGKVETVEQARNSSDVENALATARAQLGIEDPTIPGTENIPVFDPSKVELEVAVQATVPQTVKSKHR